MMTVVRHLVVALALTFNAYADLRSVNDAEVAGCTAQAVVVGNFELALLFEEEASRRWGTGDGRATYWQSVGAAVSLALFVISSDPTGRQRLERVVARCDALAR